MKFPSDAGTAGESSPSVRDLIKNLESSRALTSPFSPPSVGAAALVGPPPPAEPMSSARKKRSWDLDQDLAPSSMRNEIVPAGSNGDDDSSDVVLTIERRRRGVREAYGKEVGPGGGAGRRSSEERKDGVEAPLFVSPPRPPPHPSESSRCTGGRWASPCLDTDADESEGEVAAIKQRGRNRRAGPPLRDGGGSGGGRGGTEDVARSKFELRMTSSRSAARSLGERGTVTTTAHEAGDRNANAAGAGESNNVSAVSEKEEGEGMTKDGDSAAAHHHRHGRPPAREEEDDNLGIDERRRALMRGLKERLSQRVALPTATAEQEGDWDGDEPSPPRRSHLEGGGGGNGSSQRRAVEEEDGNDDDDNVVAEEEGSAALSTNRSSPTATVDDSGEMTDVSLGTANDVGDNNGGIGEGDPRPPRAPRTAGSSGRGGDGNSGGPSPTDLGTVERDRRDDRGKCAAAGFWCWTSGGPRHAAPSWRDRSKRLGRGAGGAIARCRNTLAALMPDGRTRRTPGGGGGVGDLLAWTARRDGRDDGKKTSAAALAEEAGDIVRRDDGDGDVVGGRSTREEEEAAGPSGNDADGRRGEAASTRRGRIGVREDDSAPGVLHHCTAAAAGCLGEGWAALRHGLGRGMRGAEIWCRKLGHSVSGRYQTLAEGWGQLPRVAGVLVGLCVTTRRGAFISLASVVVAMTSTLYPTAPRCNAALAAIGLYIHAAQENLSRCIYIQLLILVVLSIAVDLDWIASDSYPVPLALNQDAFGFNLTQESSVTRLVARYLVLANICLKVALLFNLMGQTSNGRRLQRAMWHKLHIFCPPTSMRLPKRPQSAIQERIIAIVWIELICSISLLILGAVAQLKLSWSPNLSVDAPILPLKHVMLAKGISGLLFVLAILRHADLPDVAAQLGCLIGPCEDWQKGRRHLRRRQRGFDAPAVVVTEHFLKFNAFVKLVDLLVGVLMWIALRWAHKLGGRDKPKEIRIVLGASTAALALTDPLVLLLCLAVWYYYNMAKHEDDVLEHRLSTIEERNQEESSSQSSSYSADSFGSESTGSFGATNANGQPPDFTPYRVPAGEKNHDGYVNAACGDYDLLNNVRMSQNMFETRLLAVSPPFLPAAGVPEAKSESALFLQHPIPPAPPEYNALDATVACDPAEFSLLWEDLPIGAQMQCRTEKMPLMSECHDHFQKHCFYLIASGMVRDEMRLFLVAQHMGQRGLAELSFEPISKGLRIHVKSEETTLIPIFVQSLNLRLLFGDFSE